MQAQGALHLIEIVQADVTNPQAWADLAEALEADGRQPEADLCRWFAVCCEQAPGNGPLPPGSGLDPIFSHMVDQLLAGPGGDDTELATRLIILFSGLKSLRSDAATHLFKLSLDRVKPYLREPDNRADRVPGVVAIARLWAAMFRALPHEASHGYVSAGMAVPATDEEIAAWSQFTAMVSRALGRPVVEIVNKQISDLS